MCPAAATLVPVAAKGDKAAGTNAQGGVTAAQGITNAGIILRDQKFGGVNVGPITAYQFTSDANLDTLLGKVPVAFDITFT